MQFIARTIKGRCRYFFFFLIGEFSVAELCQLDSPTEFKLTGSEQAGVREQMSLRLPFGHSPLC